MATIRKRGLNQWQVQVRIQGSSPQSKTFNTQKDAQRWASLMESEILRGNANLPSKKITEPLTAYLTKYETEICPTKKGKNQEVSRIKYLKTLDIASMPIDRIKANAIALWRDQRLQQVKPATVVRELALLSHVFSVARTEWGLESLANPVEGIRKPRISNARTRRITSIEIDRLLEATESPALKAVFVIALETAMRRGEICSLEWEHIDLENRIAFLPDTKNGKSRSIPLSKRAKTLLEGLSGPREGRVFNIRPDSVTQAFARACERAKLPDLRFHDARHEATTRLFEKGLNVMETASITGHRDIRMLSRYTHLAASSLANRLD